MLLSLVRRLSSKPDSAVKADLKRQEWDRLQLILQEENQDALVLWLKQTAYKSYQLQKNFDMAAGGKKSDFCILKKRGWWLMILIHNYAGLLRCSKV